MVLGDILGTARDRIEDVEGISRRGGAGGTYAEIDEDDFLGEQGEEYGDELTAGTWRDLAEFVVDAQNSYNVGFGRADVESKVGRWYMVLDDGAGNVVAGTARLKTRDSNDENVDTEVKAVPSRKLDADPNDYRTQFAIPEQTRTPKVGEDSKVVLQFKLKSSSAGTSVDFSADATVVQIPMTNY